MLKAQRALSGPSTSSIKARDVARKGLPKMKDISTSSSMSRITKSAGNINLSTLTSMLSMTTLVCLIDQLASYKVIVVDLGLPSPSFMKILCGVTFMLALKSAKALSSTKLPIMQGTIKLSWSFNF